VPVRDAEQSRDTRFEVQRHQPSPSHPSPTDTANPYLAMYNAHRGIAGAPAPPNNRLVELLEQVRAEFEAQGGRANEYEHQRESSPFVPPNTLPWDRHLQTHVLYAVFL
jgi:hypothetical protein